VEDALHLVKHNEHEVVTRGNQGTVYFAASASQTLKYLLFLFICHRDMAVTRHCLVPSRLPTQLLRGD
jgi:hypothetical protein